MTDAEFRAVVFDAIKGLDALNSFIETRFEIADTMEEQGMTDAADEVREVWTGVWNALADAPRRALLAELHDFMMPTPADDLLDDGLIDDEELLDDEAFRLANNA